MEIDERIAALSTNVNAIEALVSAVDGTLGPKGLDTMLIDEYGNIVITNDGVTILELMEANHPAAKMVINTAKAQQTKIGDGTTTAAILTAALVADGLEQIKKGVPVVRVIEGIRIGIEMAIGFIKKNTKNVTGINDQILKKVSCIAGRGHEDIACLVFEAAKLIGEKKILEKGFKLADCVFAEYRAENELINGCVIVKEKFSDDMPSEIFDCPVLFVDDALEPEKLDREALGNEAGFNRYLELQEEFKENLRKLPMLKVGMVVVSKSIDSLAEEIFLDANILAVQRVNHKEFRQAVEFTGARAIKRTGLKRPTNELQKYFGYTQHVSEDKQLQQIRVLGGKGKPTATILVGAATEEVVGERERIAKDAASALQLAVKGGIVPGGGAIELAAAAFLEANKDCVNGMATYGLECVIEALKMPFSKITANAGFNPLEKQAEVFALQKQKKNIGYAVDCDTGQVVDMAEMQVMDPALVKMYALTAAAEVAEAILRINTIIKKKADDISLESTKEK